MKRRNKIILIFSIVYWFLICLGITLMALAFSKVPIGSYGLRVNYFSPNVDQLYYTPGLYYKNVGYYFVLYPSTKQYVIDQKIHVINNDLQSFQVTYSLCYRLNPTKIYSLYNSLAMTYESRLVAIINNLISSYYKELTQANSRVSAQSSIVNNFNSFWKVNIDSVFGGGIIVQAIWIDQIQFNQLEDYYSNAYQYSSSSNQAYIQTQVDLGIAKLQVKALQSTIKNTKAAFAHTLQLAQRSSYNQQIYQQQIQEQTSQMKLSNLYNISRVFNVDMHVYLVLFPFQIDILRLTFIQRFQVKGNNFNFQNSLIQKIPFDCFKRLQLLLLIYNVRQLIIQQLPFEFIIAYTNQIISQEPLFTKANYLMTHYNNANPHKDNIHQTNSKYQSQNYITLIQEMKNTEISADFMLCSINSLLHQAKTNQNQNNNPIYANLLQVLYQSFLIHKQQLSNLSIKVQKAYIQKQIKNQTIKTLKQDFCQKLQSLQILTFQKDYQQLLKRIGQYKKISQQQNRQQDQQSQISFLESSISNSQEQKQKECRQFQQKDQVSQLQESEILNTNKMNKSFDKERDYQQDEQFNLVFDNIEIKQVQSIQCFMTQQIQQAILQIENEDIQFQKKQQIWLSYLKKCSQSDKQQQCHHVKQEQIIKALQTFRTQTQMQTQKETTLKQQSKQGQGQSGIQQLIQTRFIQTQNGNCLQFQKFASPFKHHFAETEVNQQNKHFRTKSKSKCKNKCKIDASAKNNIKSNTKSKNKNMSEVFFKNNHLNNNEQKSMSIKKTPLSKKNKQNQNIMNMNANVSINALSKKKSKNKCDLSDQLSAKIQKKLCLNKQQKPKSNLYTDKKIGIALDKVKKDKSSQKKTVKKTLVSFCF